MSQSAFYTADNAECLQSCVQQHIKEKSTDIHSDYEITRTLTWISEGGYKQVALQFPDDMLVDSFDVLKSLQHSEATLFILGDTSYGSCCVDEVAAEHYSADAVVHYGPACLSPTSRVPVLYVFGQKLFDVDDCVIKIKQLCPDSNRNLILMYDTAYYYKIDILYHKLYNLYKSLIVSKLSILSFMKAESLPPCKILQNDSQSISEGQVFTRCNRRLTLTEGQELDSYSVLYIGRESQTLTNLMMNYNKCSFCTYDPVERVCRWENLNVNKSLMKRYYMIERAKDAHRVGIVIGTLGVSNYLKVLERLKQLIKNCGKVFYTFVIGKLNPAKLANFLEIDIFVIVACQENSLIDSSEFYKPVVTPFEMEIACNQARQWNGDYFTDFQEILPGAANYVELSAPETDLEDRADVSLIDNTVRYSGPRISEEVSDSTELTLKSCTVSTISAANFLSKRSWQGLEQNLGSTPIEAAKEGAFGIAAGYQHEEDLVKVQSVRNSETEK